ncbi:MAG TPA: nucleoside hydrolase [Feifaniaceae bacterium]|nr:nucleoside hydrolase [Feifaniaceae bacterium]
MTSTREPLRVVIDADTGIDDSIALLYALKNPAIRVHGIIASYGNTNAEQAAQNTLRIIKLASPGYEVPVVLGASRSLGGRGAGETDAGVHGENGIGGVILPPSPQQLLPEPAGDFLARVAKEYSGKLVLVTLGRLTTFAQALMQYPALKKDIAAVVSMGGTIYAPGNVSPCAEANIFGDPEAAEYALCSGIPLTLAGLDVTTKTRLTTEQIQASLSAASPENRPVWEYIEAATRHYMDFYRRVEGSKGDCPLHDPSAMICALRPALFTIRPFRAHVECGGDYCRGKIVADGRRRPFDGPDIKACVDVDAEGVLKELFRVLGGTAA